jgi:hypothetical protein
MGSQEEEEDWCPTKPFGACFREVIGGTFTRAPALSNSVILETKPWILRPSQTQTQTIAISLYKDFRFH